MSPSHRPRRPRGRLAIVLMWDRRAIADMVLVIAAIPVLLCVAFVPVVLFTGGSLPRLLGLLVVFAAVWWLLRWLLRRWVAAGQSRSGDTSS